MHDQDHGYSGVYGGLEMRQVVGPELFRVVPDDGQANLRVGGREAVVWETLGRRDHAFLPETSYGGGSHPGHHLGVLPVGTVTDRGPVAGVYDRGEVRVDACPQELASHPGRDAMRLIGVPASSERRSGGLGCDPGRGGDIAPSWSTRTKS